jgi:hypothetical protein
LCINDNGCIFDMISLLTIIFRELQLYPGFGTRAITLVVILFLFTFLGILLYMKIKDK